MISTPHRVADDYRQKHFSCEITGHMNLNYFEALKSEVSYSLYYFKRACAEQSDQMEHAQDVDQQFPEPLKEPVLRKVQFSTVSRIDTLGKSPPVVTIPCLSTNSTRISGPTSRCINYPRFLLASLTVI
jgi:hypothetical protein